MRLVDLGLGMLVGMCVAQQSLGDLPLACPKPRFVYPCVIDHAGLEQIADLGLRISRVGAYHGSNISTHQNRFGVVLLLPPPSSLPILPLNLRMQVTLA